MKVIIKYINIFREGAVTMALAMVNNGEVHVIKEIRAKEAVKKHLQNMGFIAGTQVQVVGESINGIILLIKGAKVALNRGLASQIIVE